MTDPTDIRRRREAAIYQREQAETEEADWLMSEHRRILSELDSAVADARTAERTSARLRGENVEGSVIPSIGMPSMPLPETFGDELVGRLGENEDPAAMELWRADADRMDAGRSAVPRGPTATPPRRRPSPFNPSLMPQITPGSDARMVLPETEDWGAFGGAAGAAELEAAQEAGEAEGRALGEMSGKTITPLDSARIRQDSARRRIGWDDGAGFNPPANAAEAAMRRAEGIARFAENDVRRARQAQSDAATALLPLAEYPNLTAIAADEFQGFTQGYGDEALGMIDMLGGENYEQSRDTYRAMLDQAHEMSPALGTAARVVGSIGSGMAAAPATGAAGATSLAGAAGRGALGGAVWGGLAGAGESEADDARGLLTDAGRSAAIGGVLGGALGGAGYGVGRLAERLSGSAGGVEREASRQRLAALGANQADMAAAERHFPGGVQGLADEFRGQGLASPAGTPGSFERPAEELLARSGREMGDVLDEAVAAQRGPVRGTEATLPGTPGAYRTAADQGAQRMPTADFLAQVREAALAPLERGTTRPERAQAAAIQEWIDEVATRYPDGLGARELQALKQSLQGAAFMSRRDPGAGAAAQAYNTLQQQTRGILDQQLDDIGSRIGSPEMAQRFQSARRQSQAAHLADEWIGRALDRGSANNVMQPLAEVRAAADGGLTGLATGALRQVFRNRQHSLAGTALEGLGRTMRAAPGRARTATTLAERLGLPAFGVAAGSTATDRDAAPSAPADSAEAQAEYQADIDELLGGTPEEAAPTGPAGTGDEDFDRELDELLGAM